MTELRVFVGGALAAGKKREEIQAVLTQAGWPQKDIGDAFSSYADIDFPVPIPKHRNVSWAKEAFLYLVAFLMLYMATISLGNLWSGFVDMKFPDPVQDQDSYFGEDFRHEAIRWLLASLIVSFPAWFFMTRHLLVGNAKDPERRISPVRSWLTYITLFLAASCILTTLVVFTAGALSGEFAIRSVLKCGIVVLLAGSIFTFYFWDLQKSESPSPARRHSTGLTITGLLVWITVLGTVGGALVTAGSPIEARKERADERREQDLNNLAYGIRTYYANHKALPEDQDKAFGAVGRTANSYRDPETQEKYGYRVIDKQHFELSATFQTDRMKSDLGLYASEGTFTRHKAGPEKFVLDAKGPGS